MVRKKFYSEIQYIDQHLDTTTNQNTPKFSVSKILSTTIGPIKQSLITVIHSCGV